MDTPENLTHRTKYDKPATVILRVEEDQSMTIVSGRHKGRRAACAAAKDLAPGTFAVGFITDEIRVIEPPKGPTLFGGEE